MSNQENGGIALLTRAEKNIGDIEAEYCVSLQARSVNLKTTSSIIARTFGQF